jgi:hypothetical protein
METEKGGLYSNSGRDFTIHVLAVLPVMAESGTTERIVEVRDEPQFHRAASHFDI